MKRRSTVEVEIIGGLGNQLFGYAAGLFLSRKVGSDLILNLGLVGVGGTDHGKSIRGFSLPEEIFIESKKTTNQQVLINRIANKLARHSKLFKKSRDFLLRDFTSIELGFEESFWNLRGSRKIRGYFQTHLYADTVKIELRESLVITNTSIWYRNQIEKLNECNPVGIHMRRGDYLGLMEEFGILDISYYVSIVERNNLQSRPIWIFTDSPEMVAQEIIGTILEESCIINPPKESSVNESLLLMSMCETLLISNSTFSWWAAYLNKPTSSIHAPSKWFKGRPDPERLIPDTWKSHESIWMK
jgi:hypothetical protein